MKKLLIALLLASSCASTVFAEEYSENPIIVNQNWIYIDEVFEGGDEGFGATAELAFIIQEIEDLSMTVGYEIGYIKSDYEGKIAEFGFGEIDADLIPIFVNYTLGSSRQDSRLVWDVGAGFGVVIAEAEIGLDGADLSDNDLVFGGQIFGSLGYKLTDTFKLSLGLRYMIAEDFDFQDSFEDSNVDFQLDETFNSLAFEVSLNVLFPVFTEESTENTTISRFNWLYVDEVFDVDVNNEGNGATVELAFIIEETENKFVTIGYEIGYLKAENGGSVLGVTADLDGTIDLDGIDFNGTIRRNGRESDITLSTPVLSTPVRTALVFSSDPNEVLDLDQVAEIELTPPSEIRVGVSNVELEGNDTVEFDDSATASLVATTNTNTNVLLEFKSGTTNATFTDTPIQLSEIDVDMIPIFVNYTIGGRYEDSRTYWDFGAGFGVIIAEVDIGLQGFPTMNDDDLVFGGQLFGSVGYEITEAVNLFFGMRYMIAEDFDFQDSVEISEGLTLDADFQLDKAFNSIAYEIGLNIFF